MKADFWRYLVLYLKGGVYSDTDARLMKSLYDWEFDPFNNY